MHYKQHFLYLYELVNDAASAAGKHLVMCGRNVSGVQRVRLYLKVHILFWMFFGARCSNNYDYVACVIKIYADIRYLKLRTILYLIWWEYHLSLLLQTVQLDRNTELHQQPLEIAPVGRPSNLNKNGWNSGNTKLLINLVYLTLILDINFAQSDYRATIAALMILQIY